MYAGSHLSEALPSSSGKARGLRSASGPRGRDGASGTTSANKRQDGNRATAQDQAHFPETSQDDWSLERDVKKTRWLLEQPPAQQD